MKTFPHWLMMVLTLTILVLFTIGAWFYRVQNQNFQKKVEAELLAIAQLKVDQIDNWRNERLNDGAILIGSSSFSKTVWRFIKDPQTDNTEKLRAELEPLLKYNYYADIQLVDTNGRKLLSLSGRIDPLHEVTTKLLFAAFRDRKPIFTEFYTNPIDSRPYLDVIAPMFGMDSKSSEPIGAVILQIDPEQFLYPLIQYWPSPSQTAETVLIRRDGDAALYLNNLRHKKDTALKLRIPVSQKSVPAVKAVLGAEGFVGGEDYRSIEVLAVARAIPNSSWFIVAKVDTMEALADWRTNSAVIFALFLGLLLAVIASALAFWQSKVKIYYQYQYQAEVMLRETEEKYHVLTDNLLDAVLLTGINDEIYFANPAASRMFGMSVEEIYATGRNRLFEAQDPRLAKMLEKQVSYESFRGEINNRRNDGTIFPTDISSSVFADKNGKPLITMIIRDISERKEAEEKVKSLLSAVQEERERLSAVINSITDEVWFCDTQGKIVLANPSASLEFCLDITGNIGVEHLAARLEAFRPDGRPRPIEEVPLRRALAGEIIKRQESILRTPASGELHHREINASPVKDANGNIIGSVAVVRDITDRKKAEEEIRKSREQYRTLVENIPIGVMSVDRNLGITSWNGMAQSITGLSPDECLGKHCFEILQCDELKGSCPLQEAIENKSVIGPIERHIVKNGTMIPVRCV
ncbi:MAG: PAS domain S-box protein, partial [Deltaproteobacteria bacterium]|nr:PAS domain S-box protein [Deltaproteobacteria bacterium]